MRKLDYNEFKNLYKDRMVEDFPFYERRPLFTIKSKYKKGQYACFVLEEEKEIQAYATFAWKDKKKVWLLDYFAVDKSQRGSGIGSKFIEEIKETMDTGLILLECEMVEDAEDLPTRKIRKKRIDFYKKNGVEMTDVEISLLGYKYNIMALALNDRLEKYDLADEILSIYYNTIPYIFYRLFVKVNYQEEK